VAEFFSGLPVRWHAARHSAAALKNSTLLLASTAAFGSPRERRIAADGLPLVAARLR
jgi:hypothetical protein